MVKKQNKWRTIAIIVSLIAAAYLFTACKSSPAHVPDELDAAIWDASDYLNNNIPRGSKIVILNVQSDSAALSDYIIDELIANAVNDRIFTVVDRHQLDSIRAELNFQLSGEVDDNQALSIGRFFGAQTIISGRVSMVGERYRLSIRALGVETTQVQGQYNRNIAPGATITALMRNPGSAAAAANRPATQTQPAAAVVPAPGSTQTPAQSAGAQAGTYTFWPRPQATQGGRPVRAYLDKVIVSGGFVTLYITSVPAGVGSYSSIDGSWQVNRSFLQNLDRPSSRPFTAVKEGTDDFTDRFITFQNVTGLRFTFINESSTPPIVFNEIVLGVPD